MKHKFFTSVFFCAFFNLSAQTDNYRQELLNLADISRLSLYRAGEMEQLSSYDRTGGNDDGFSGKYSSIRKEAEGLVIADLRGPGTHISHLGETQDALARRPASPTQKVGQPVPAFAFRLY